MKGGPEVYKSITNRVYKLQNTQDMLDTYEELFEQIEEFLNEASEWEYPYGDMIRAFISELQGEEHD